MSGSKWMIQRMKTTQYTSDNGWLSSFCDKNRCITFRYEKKRMHKKGPHKRKLVRIKKLFVRYKPWKNGWQKVLRWKNHPSLKNGWFKLILQRKLTAKKMDGRSLLLSSNIAILYFKYGREQVVLWKKICCLYKSLKLQIDPLNKN